MQLDFAQVKSMDDNCGEWVECMGVANGCGEQEAGVASVASGSGWNLWVFSRSINTHTGNYGRPTAAI